MDILVEYGNQLKPINVIPTDNLSSLQRKINMRFGFNIQQMGLQLQWYDETFRKFIDLDNETWSKYEKNQKLPSNQINASASEILLKVVCKQVPLQHSNTPDQQRIRPATRQNSESPLLNNTYTIVHGISEHETNGIREQRNHSQAEHTAQSIHTDRVLNVLSWVLPLIAIFAYIGDAVWIMTAYDPNTEEQQNYAGLTSTILILFYYLQYDVPISITHPKLYIVYQLFVFFGIVTGDVLYAYYYGHCRHDKGLMVIFILYVIIDGGFVLYIGYLKYYRKLRVTMGLSIHNLFHLMSRVEVLLIILIPLYSTYDVISTNSIAFFILYDFFSHYYNNRELTYSRLSRLSFWLLIILATGTVIFENVEFIYARREQQAKEEHDPINEKYNREKAHLFQYTSNAFELAASVACYSLLSLQFFSTSDKQRKTVHTDYESIPD